MSQKDLPVESISEVSVNISDHLLPAIPADYFNITDTKAWPVAGLLVFLDSARVPVQSELHLYDELSSQVAEAAVRRARQLLEANYAGGEPVPLRIFQTFQLREAMSVRLPAATESPQVEKTTPHWLPIALGIAGVVILLLAIWGFSSLFLTGESADQTDVAAAVVADDSSAADAVNADGSQAAGSDAASADAQPAAGAPVQNADLPPSRNARNDVNIGVRVRILPGLTLTLRSEAGPEAGDVLGFMAEGDEAVVIGGPVVTQGTSDTIVWWLVQLDDGLEAWAAANTSERTLLAPTP